MRSSESSGKCDRLSSRWIGGRRPLADACTIRLGHRVLGTPNDDIWPGVSSLPDYKPSFPQWNAVDLEAAVPSLDASGIDLLSVSTEVRSASKLPWIDSLPIFQRTLVYDPAHRISGKSTVSYCTRSGDSRHHDSSASSLAKRALQHDYFKHYRAAEA